MKILYFSVHTVLEYDEIRLLKALNHHVFPLGSLFGFQTPNILRPNIEFNDFEKRLLERFVETGCHYVNSEPLNSIVLTPEFVSEFDVLIFMHDLDLILRLWPNIRHRPVVWRTIGQNIEGYESLAAGLRAQGLRIVRYSQKEALAPGYNGEDALILFGKSPMDYPIWNGIDKIVLTFSNWFKQRYADEYAVYEEMIAGIPSKLGGMGNELIPNSVGVAPPAVQTKLYQESRVYLYCSGTMIPYTLNFIEALMTGMPIVVYDPQPRKRYYDIPALTARSESVILVNTAAEGREAILNLLDDEALATKLSTNARQTGFKLFSFDVIMPQWQHLLDKIV